MIKTSRFFNNLSYKYHFTKRQRMVQIFCQPDLSCPYQYYCDTANNECLHQPVFPINGYPIAIYCLFPFASAICNTTGNSFGQFKVVLLMLALNYSQAQATIVSYPLVAGTALYNFFALMFRRHPQKQTTLVDYNIVMIIVPNVLYGSTIGTILNDILPPIVANVLITILLALFSIKFFCKLRSLIQEEQQQQKERKEKEEREERERPKGLEIDFIIKKPQSSQNLKNNQLQNKPALPNADTSEQRVVARDQNNNPYQQELNAKIQYEKSLHFPQIIAVLVIFAVFAVLSLLAQGKIVQFSNCSKYYGIGMAIFTVFYIVSLILFKKYYNNRMELFRTIGYDYPYALDTWKYFGIICVGAFFGGFNAGLFSKGNSTTIIFSLVYLQIQPIVSSAIVGFQVVFSAAVSLIQAYSKGQLTSAEIGFFLGVTFVAGGLFSFILSVIIKDMKKSTINKILVGIIGCLTCMSAISMIISTGISYNMFGSDYMNKPADFCQA